MTFRLQWPTDARRINQHFLNNPEFYLQFSDIPGHEGLDFFAPEGASIYAAADGVVVETFRDNRSHPYGNHVRIDHKTPDGTFQTVYAHLSNFIVTEGQEVNAGQLIGHSGNTGNSFGAHLHLTLKRKGATAANATQYRTEDGRTVTVPRDIIDPTPYLLPQPPRIPSRPVLPNFHPAFGDNTPVPPPIQVRHIPVEGLTLNFEYDDKIESYDLSGNLAVTVKNAPPMPEDIVRTEDGDTQLHMIQISGPVVLTIQGELPWVKNAPRPIDPPIVDPPTPPQDNADAMVITSQIGLNVRRIREISPNTLITRMQVGTELDVKPERVDEGGFIWRQIVRPMTYEGFIVRNMWVAERRSDNSQVYLSPR